MGRLRRLRPMRGAGRVGRVLLAAVTMIGAVGLVTTEPAHAADALETLYEATGSFGPTMEVDVPDPAAPGESFAIFRPTTLGGPSGTYDHPILVWGNGSGVEDTGATYGNLLGHLASWGYVVVSPNDGWVGNGDRLRAAVDYMVSQNGNPSSPFHQKLNVTKIGGFGHSQGSGGAAIATMEASPGLIDTVAAIGFPDPWTWCNDILPPPPDAPPCQEIGDPTQLLTGFPASLFLIRGQFDTLATDGSSCASPDGYPDIPRGCYTEWYEQVPGMAAKATHDLYGHLPYYEYRGYITAWFEYVLKGSTTARGVFAGTGAELFTNSEWNQFPTLTAVKNPI